MSIQPRLLKSLLVVHVRSNSSSERRVSYTLLSQGPVILTSSLRGMRFCCWGSFCTCSSAWTNHCSRVTLITPFVQYPTHHILWNVPVFKRPYRKLKVVHLEAFRGGRYKLDKLFCLSVAECRGTTGSLLRSHFSIREGVIHLAFCKIVHLANSFYRNTSAS